MTRKLTPREKKILLENHTWRLLEVSFMYMFATQPREEGQPLEDAIRARLVITREDTIWMRRILCPEGSIEEFVDKVEDWLRTKEIIPETLQLFIYGYPRTMFADPEERYVVGIRPSVTEEGGRRIVENYNQYRGTAEKLARVISITA